jgi:hypothetical protein
MRIIGPTDGPDIAQRFRKWLLFARTGQYVAACDHGCHGIICNDYQEALQRGADADQQCREDIEEEIYEEHEANQ